MPCSGDGDSKGYSTQTVDLTTNPNLPRGRPARKFTVSEPHALNSCGSVSGETHFRRFTAMAYRGPCDTLSGYDAMSANVLKPVMRRPC